MATSTIADEIIRAKETNAILNRNNFHPSTSHSPALEHSGSDRRKRWVARLTAIP
jgi:hypothetical protein